MNLFFTEDKPNDPYTQSRFATDFAKSPDLQQMGLTLQSWLNEETKKKASDALWNYGKVFADAIDKFYSAWET